MTFKAKAKAKAKVVVDDVEIRVTETGVGADGWAVINASFIERGFLFSRHVKAAQCDVGYERRKLVKRMERLQARSAELTDDELAAAVADGSLDVEVTDADEA